MMDLFKELFGINEEGVYRLSRGGEIEKYQLFWKNIRKIVNGKEIWYADWITTNKRINLETGEIEEWDGSWRPRGYRIKRTTGEIEKEYILDIFLDGRKILKHIISILTDIRIHRAEFEKLNPRGWESLGIKIGKNGEFQKI